MIAVELSNVSFSYGKEHVLEHISATIKKGDFVALLGPNGSGKTTLAKIMSGQLEPLAGDVLVFGKKPFALAQNGMIGYVPQQCVTDPVFPGTVAEILELQTGGGEAAHMLQIEGLLHKKFVELSGGQQQRVMIAFAIQQKPKLLLLDEPTAGVDMHAQETFYKLLQELNTKKSMTIILITHDVSVVPRIAKSVICLNRTICCTGPASATNTMIKKVYGGSVQEFSHRGHEHV